jgi:hypothetical protein
VRFTAEPSIHHSDTIIWPCLRSWSGCDIFTFPSTQTLAIEAGQSLYTMAFISCSGECFIATAAYGSSLNEDAGEKVKKTNQTNAISFRVQWFRP